MATDELRCWKCTELLEDVLSPMPRQAKCRHCKVDLHVCRMCEFYDTTVNNACREPIAEKVNDKTRANFCGYYQVTAVDISASNAQVEASKSSLEDLFGIAEGESGISSSSAEESRQALDSLFGLDETKKPD